MLLLTQVLRRYLDIESCWPKDFLTSYRWLFQKHIIAPVTLFKTTQWKTTCHWWRFKDFVSLHFLVDCRSQQGQCLNNPGQYITNFGQSFTTYIWAFPWRPMIPLYRNQSTDLKSATFGYFYMMKNLVVDGLITFEVFIVNLNYLED